MTRAQKVREYVVVSVGGSLIVPDSIDSDFLSRFRELILQKVKEGFRFAIIPGGGKTCRRYQAVGKEIAPLSQDEVDWIGIHVNCMHAEFLRIVFGEYAAPAIVQDMSSPLTDEYPLILVGADRPGHSSDYDAVEIAKTLGAHRLVNLSNIDYAYDSDPKENPHARKLENVSWEEFRSVIPDHWSPGLSSPFDPVAAKEAEALNLEVAIINGAKLEEFDNYLNGVPFTGTTIGGAAVSVEKAMT